MARPGFSTASFQRHQRSALGRRGAVALVLRSGARSAPCARRRRKGAFLGAPSASPEIPEMCYVQQKVLIIERLSDPSTCWFCRTLQLVGLFVCLQPGNLSVLKTLRVPFFTCFTVTVVGSEACNPGKKYSAKIPHQRFN